MESETGFRKQFLRVAFEVSERTYSTILWEGSVARAGKALFYCLILLLSPVKVVPEDAKVAGQVIRSLTLTPGDKGTPP